MVTLNIQSLTAGYGPTTIIAGASACARPGGLTVLIGPNGTGKSTFLKAIAGLIPATGSIALCGLEIPQRQRSKTVSYMPQDVGGASSLTVLEVVLLGRLRSLGLSVPAHLPTEALALLNRFGIGHLESRSLDALSGGQKQLVFLAQALFRDPDVLLLDEPTAALDLRHQLVVLNAVRDHARERGVVAIAAMHDLSLAAQFAQEIICLSGGTVVASGPAGDVLTEERLRDVYGVEASVARTHAGFLSITPLRPCA
ncbi:ABC transporter ATP-binding protein [Hwanghaeella grinnelliae]|uniref:ABC transporter ATP-binding protein n=1 Tax=Hwanghaeella grinnelliae TaxID=2500179 RepID=A0A3S2W2D8_9PROT|nr:ABC transporter ATP-binding protein [Hwanghaeella grinnelliae]RVU34064.1 ABC transporter ATP-binding protein [Hwanghaeella grinnelliae]